MRKYTYRKIDAFTSGKSRGNPAAYLFTGYGTLTHEEMLAFGKEHKGFVNDVVFCSVSDTDDVKLTYYSSECEVDFCGHGTVATMYDYIKSDDTLRKKPEIVIDTNRKGRLTVYNRLEENDSVYITAPEAKRFPVPASPEETADALGLQNSAFSSELPLDLIDAGLRTLIVPLGEFLTEVTLYPDSEKLKLFCVKNGIDAVLTFCKETGSPDYIAHTRVFSPKFGYLEDPATGSGNSAFADYMIRNGMWDGTPTKVEQGGDDIVFNSVELMKKDDKILFGGSATLRIAGEYFMQ